MQHQLPCPTSIAIFFHGYVEEIELSFLSRAVDQGDKYLRLPAALLLEVVPDDGNSSPLTFLDQLAVYPAPGKALLWRETP